MSKKAVYSSSSTNKTENGVSYRNLLAGNKICYFSHQFIILFANSIVSLIQKFNLGVIRSQMTKKYVTKLYLARAKYVCMSHLHIWMITNDNWATTAIHMCGEKCNATIYYKIENSLNLNLVAGL